MNGTVLKNNFEEIPGAPEISNLLRRVTNSKELMTYFGYIGTGKRPTKAVYLCGGSHCGSGVLARIMQLCAREFKYDDCGMDPWFFEGNQWRKFGEEFFTKNIIARTYVYGREIIKRVNFQRVLLNPEKYPCLIFLACCEGYPDPHYKLIDNLIVCSVPPDYTYEVFTEEVERKLKEDKDYAIEEGKHFFEYCRSLAETNPL